MSETEKSKNERLKYLALDRNVVRYQNAFLPILLKYSVLQGPDPVIGNFSVNEGLPIMVTASNLIKLSKNKIGARPTNQIERKDFDLTDPNLYETSIRYHPLDDPALKRHFHRPVVKSRLLDSGLITSENDVFCSVQEFNDHIRCLNDAYLKQASSVKDISKGTRVKLKAALKTSRQANEMLRTRIRAFEIAKDKKLITETSKKDPFEKYQQCLEKENEALKRVNAFKEQKRLQARGFVSRWNTVMDRRKLMEKNDRLKRKELIKNGNLKILLANSRRAFHRFNNLETKRQKELDFKRKQCMYRIENSLNNNELITSAEEQRSQDVQEHMRQTRRIRENFEFQMNRRKAKVIQKLYEKKSAETITKYLIDKLKAYVEHDDHDSQQSTFAVESPSKIAEFLQKGVVLKSVRRSFEILNDLKLPSSTLNIVKQTLCFLKEIAYNPLRLKMPRDLYVRNFLIDRVAEIVYEIKEVQAAVAQRNSMNSDSKRKSFKSHHSSQQGNSMNEKPDEEKKTPIARSISSLSIESYPLDDKSNSSAVFINEDIAQIGEPAYFDEDADLKSVAGRAQTPTFSLQSLVEVQIIKFVQRVQDSSVEVPESMNTKDLIHLHDFQKRILLMHFRQLKIYLKLKVERDWDKFLIGGRRPKIATNRSGIISSMVESMLNFPEKHHEYANNISLLGGVICSEISSELRRMEPHHTIDNLTQN